MVETKGRVWEGTDNKDAAVEEWCRAVSEQTGQSWRYVRVNQPVFERVKPRTFARLVDAILNPLVEASLFSV